MPSTSGVLMGVGAVVLTGGAAAGYFGVLAATYAAGLAGTGALSLVGGAIIPCVTSSYAIRGRVAFANGATGPATIRLQDGKTRKVTADAPDYEFTGLSAGAYVVSVSVPSSHRLEPASQQVTLVGDDADDIDFTVTLIAKTAVQWNGTMRMTYGTELDGTHLNASLVRADNAQPVDGTATYTYASGTPFNRGKEIINPGTRLRAGSVLPAGNHNLQVEFDVADATRFTRPEAAATVRLVVEQAQPVVTFAKNAAKEYDEDFIKGDVIVSATFQGKDVPGECEIEGSTHQPFEVGAQTVKVKFKPTSSQNFKTSTGEVPIRVDKRQLRIEWNPPGDIDHGTPLSGTQLNARLVPDISKQLVYEPAGGMVLKGGNHSLKATYALSAYNQARYIKPPEATVSLRVRPVEPVLTAVNVQAEQNPGPLLSAHINARARFRDADVPGTFTYLPNLNTNLAVGAPQVTVGFTPADGATFLATATAVVTLNVVRVTAAQRLALGIGANAEQHILRGDVDAGNGTLAGAHSPDIPNWPDYQTRNVVVRASGARDMEVRRSYGQNGANRTAWKSSTLPPAGWDDDRYWDATRETLNNPASRVQDPVTNRWLYEADIPNPPQANLRWKVIRDPTDAIVITSYPLR